MKSEAIAYYIDHPVEFAQDILKVNPTKDQASVMNDVAKYPLVSVKSGHGVGKSALESWIIWWYISTRPYPKIMCTAPTKHQLHDALQGTHAEHVLIIIDEASGVPDIVFEPVLGSMSTKDAKLLMCGNPTQLSGFFYDSHTKLRSMYETHTIDGSKSEMVDPNYVKQIIEMFGKDSDVYRVRVAGEFPKANPDSFISLGLVEESIQNKQLANISSISLGVDVARFGDDESVISLVFNYIKLDSLKIFKHNDTMKLTGQIVNIIQELNHQYPNIYVKVKIDCDGLGVGVYDRLKEVISQKGLKAIAIECHFGGKGGKVSYDEPIEYKNSTGIMWGTIRSKLLNKSLFLCNDDELVSQLTNRKYFIESDGTIRLEKKEEMKKRGVHSPDRADALALALYEPTNKMEMSNTPFI